MAAHPEPSRFPILLTVFCASLAVVLFFSHTVPAAAEQRELRDLMERRSQMLDDLRNTQRELAGTERSLAIDPQTLLVEIDKLGLTPDELLERYPPAADGESAGGR